MPHMFLTIAREEEGRQVVRAPRTTDALGHALRGAFDGHAHMPDDMAILLRRLDAMTNRSH